MLKDRNYRIKQENLEADLTVVTALQRLADYQPMSEEYSLEALEELKDALERAEQNEIHAQKTLVAARDAKVMLEWELHDRVLGTKDQVRAQYGPNSDAIQLLGLKKKSKYRQPTPRLPST